MVDIEWYCMLYAGAVDSCRLRPDTVTAARIVFSRRVVVATGNDLSAIRIGMRRDSRLLDNKLEYAGAA